MSNSALPSSRLDTFMLAHTDFLSHSDTTDPPNTECPVCVEGIEEHICVKIVNIDGCTHLIGLECLKALFEHMPDAEKKCPLCRTQWIPEHIASYVPQQLNEIDDRRRDWDALHDPVLGHGHGHGGHRNYFGVDMHFSGPGRDAFLQLSNRRRDRDAERHATLVALLANDPGVDDTERMADMLANVPSGRTRSGHVFRPTVTSRSTAPSRLSTPSRPAVPFNPRAPSRLTITALAGHTVTDRLGHTVAVPLGHTGVFRFDVSGRFLELDMQQNECDGHGTSRNDRDRRHSDGRYGGRDTRHGHGRRRSEYP
jgi:hypothetical protein